LVRADLGESREQKMVVAAGVSAAHVLARSIMIEAVEIEPLLLKILT
jgi:hypothetical protein